MKIRRRLCSSILVNEQTEIVAYSPYGGFADMANGKTHMNFDRFLPSEKAVLLLQEAMANAMFERSLVEVSLPLSNGKLSAMTIRYIAEARLWLLAGYYQPPENNLSPRQQEIIQGIVDDKTLQEISKDLGITESSVQSHLAAARAKHGFDNTCALVAWAVSQEFVTT